MTLIQVVLISMNVHILISIRALEDCIPMDLMQIFTQIHILIIAYFLLDLLGLMDTHRLEILGISLSNSHCFVECTV